MCDSSPAPTQLLPPCPGWGPRGSWGTSHTALSVPAFPGCLAPARDGCWTTRGYPGPSASPRSPRSQADLTLQALQLRPTLMPEEPFRAGLRPYPAHSKPAQALPPPGSPPCLPVHGLTEVKSRRPAGPPGPGRTLTHIEGVGCRPVSELQVEEVGGLRVMAQPQGHTQDHTSGQLGREQDSVSRVAQSTAVNVTTREKPAPGQLLQAAHTPSHLRSGTPAGLVSEMPQEGLGPRDLPASRDPIAGPDPSLHCRESPEKGPCGTRHTVKSAFWMLGDHGAFPSTRQHVLSKAVRPKTGGDRFILTSNVGLEK